MSEWSCLLNVAFPDIEEIQVTENLEFVIMACDGECVRVCMCVCVCVCVCVACTYMPATGVHKQSHYGLCVGTCTLLQCVHSYVCTYLCVCAFEEMESFLLNP